MNEVTIAVVLDGMDLTDAQWAILEPLFRPPRHTDGRGRPWADTRAVLNGVLWVLRTGAPWHDLPHRYPSYQTCHRRFQTWQRTRVLERVLQGLAEDLRDRGKLDLSEAFIDASFSSAKQGAPPSALLAAVRAAKSWRLATAMVFLSPSPWPVLRRMKSRSSTPPLPPRSFDTLPPRLIGDRGYDSDRLDAHLHQTYGIEMIAKHHPHRRRRTQDGRPLRRARRGWKIERLFAWLHNYRRIVTRWERHQLTSSG